MKQGVFVLICCLILSVALEEVQGEKNNVTKKEEKIKSWKKLPPREREKEALSEVDQMFLDLKRSIANISGPKPIEQKQIDDVQITLNDLYYWYEYLVETIKEVHSHST